MPSSSVGCLAFQKVIGVGPGREISGSKTSSFLQANLPELEMFKTRKSEPKKLRHQLLDTLRMRWFGFKSWANVTTSVPLARFLAIHLRIACIKRKTSQNVAKVIFMGRVSIRACKLYVYMAISCNAAVTWISHPIPAASCPKWPGHKLSWKKKDWETSGNASFFKPSHTKRKYHSDYLLSIIVIIITIIIILIDFPKQNPLFWETMILQIKDFFSQILHPAAYDSGGLTSVPQGSWWIGRRQILVDGGQPFQGQLEKEDTGIFWSRIVFLLIHNSEIWNKYYFVCCWCNFLWEQITSSLLLGQLDVWLPSVPPNNVTFWLGKKHADVTMTWSEVTFLPSRFITLIPSFWSISSKSAFLEFPWHTQMGKTAQEIIFFWAKKLKPTFLVPLRSLDEGISIISLARFHHLTSTPSGSLSLSLSLRQIPSDFPQHPLR